MFDKTIEYKFELIGTDNFLRGYIEEISGGFIKIVKVHEYRDKKPYSLPVGSKTPYMLSCGYVKAFYPVLDLK